MTYHADLLARPAPRYTSYPTAAEFHDGVGGNAQVEALAAIAPDEPISLYLHIPFCEKICFYCGCNTGAANRAARLANYMARLEDEIEWVARQLDGRGRVVRVAFGGGSPNAISADQFVHLAERVVDALGGDRATWSTELDPRGFDERFAEAIAKVGITRASLGVQTLDPIIQQAIGRVQPASEVARASELLREAGVDSLNFDLMYGLPGQTGDKLHATLEEAHSMRPDRLAVFGYAHVPTLIPRQRKIDASALPDARRRFAHAEHARDYLTAHGYEPIGLDHYSLPDDPMAVAARAGRMRRNFQGYTDDPCATLIGLGASAISRFRDAFVQNEKNAGRYSLRVGNAVPPATRGLARTALDRVRGGVIERWLCEGRANLALLADRRVVLEGFDPFIARGLVHVDGEEIALADDAWPYARVTAALMDPHFQRSERRFSSAV